MCVLVCVDEDAMCGVCVRLYVQINQRCFSTPIRLLSFRPPIASTIKVAVLGFRAVGKSAVTIRYVEDHFVDAYNPTIENTFQKVQNTSRVLARTGVYGCC